MSIINIINENIVLTLSDIALGQSIKKHLDFLQKSQWWSKSDLKEYQNEKLIALIKHAYENVPYYNELFRKLKLHPNDIGNTDDLKKLPILTKEDIRDNFKNGKIIAQNIPKKELILSGSSGSTGEPLQYYITRNAHSFSIACGIRGWYWMGYRLGDKYVKISQYDRSLFKKVQDILNRSKYLPAKELSEKYFDDIVRTINSFRPKIIRGYPDQMHFLAKYIQNNQICISSPVAITTTGNVLHKRARDIIEEQIGAPVFDSYSCEGSANVSECPMHSCYHSSIEYAITEIISNDTEVEKGERGHFITTDLQNYAIPFIRYDTQDCLVKSKEQCSCGRNLLAIDKIEGRDSDILITPSGKFLITVQFDGYFQHEESVKQFQIIQERIDSIIIKLVVNKRLNSKEKEKFYNYWKDYIGADVSVEIHIVNDIPLTISGKRRYLIRNKDIKIEM